MAFGYIAKLFRRYGPVLTTGSVFTLWREARYRKAHGSAPQRVVRVRLARRPFSHVSLRADSDDPHTVVEIFHDAVYQPALDALGECRSIIDLGANIGLSCLYFADRCPGAKIFALEPFPSNYKLLQINTAALLRAGVCRTLQAAFWRDEDTNLTFRLPEENSSAAVFLAPASETPASLLRALEASFARSLSSRESHRPSSPQHCERLAPAAKALRRFAPLQPIDT